ncbi:ABC transporter permease [Skermania sp. ID1734]|uniref:ABC transporter permease n=1 Tax=Skermania sp. ID1734 TaxID=2597516 RepID=UPI00118019D5|nr:ABC transporter permease [Skermania sp. ID1734]TSD93544.1 ABC transporter permease [Skermania sp. ID1734]
MTATTFGRRIPARRTSTRLLNVARLHHAASPLLIVWPIGVVAVSFAIALAIFFVTGDDASDSSFTGGVFSLYAFTLAFYLQALTQTFPFALGLSVTRREYFTATTLVAVSQSTVFGAALFVLALGERVTNGWGVHMRMFDIPAYWTDNPILQLLTPIVSLFLVTTIGLFVGCIHQRWRTQGLLTAGLTVAVALGISAIVVTWQRWWLDIGHWFADIPRAYPLVVFPALAAAVALAGAWVILRRTAPA